MHWMMILPTLWLIHSGVSLRSPHRQSWIFWPSVTKKIDGDVGNVKKPLYLASDYGVKRIGSCDNGTLYYFFGVTVVKLLLGLTAAAIPFWVLAWLSKKKIVVDVVTAVTNSYSAVESRRKKIKSIVVRFVGGVI